MSMRKTAALAIVVLLMGALSSVATAATRYACTQVNLDVKPLWISSAVWWKQASRVVVVDAFRNKLLAYSLRGEREVLPNPQNGEFLPVRIAESTDRAGGERKLLLEVADGQVLRLDGKMKYSGVEAIQRQRAAGGFRVGSLYDWTVTSNSLVAYGALLDQADNPRMGFFRAPLSGNPARLVLVKPFDEGEFYLVGNRYLASIGDDSYFVVMSKNPALYRLAAGSDTAEAVRLKIPGSDSFRLMPRGFETRPDFTTHMTGPKSAPAHLAELETFSIPAGLYSQKHELYLLTRNPDGKKGTAWTFFKIDPGTETIVGSVKLPTHADFLTIVPTDENWLVFERGRVGEGQHQDNPSMLVIPSAAVSELALPQACAAGKK